MSSAPYARKKATHEGDNHNTLDHTINMASAGGSRHPFPEPPSSTEKRSKRQQNQAGIRVAYFAVGLFTAGGLLLGYLLLHHRHRSVILHVMKNPWAHGGAALRNVARRSRHSATGHLHHFYSGNPEFVTIVLPSVVNPEGRSLRLESIHDTWGPCARAIFVNHDITDFPQGKHLTISEDSSLKLTDKYSYPQNLLLPQSIGNEDGVRRLFYTIKSIYEKVNPDFAFFVNDHTYVYADHLHSFLEQVLPDHTLYAGHALKNNNIIFNSGAAGYVLSRETIRQIVHRHEEKDPNCWLDEEKPNSEQKWLQGNPGLLLTTCLNSMGVRAIDTRDHHKHHKFHAFPITRLVKGNVDDWYINKHHFQELPLEERRGFDSSYFQLLNGPDCCSEHTISFHYVEYKESRALFSVRDALTNNPQMSNDELHKFMTSVWPSTRKEIGAYSRGLPPAEKQDEWSDLIDTIRKISIREDSGDCHIK